MALQLVDTERPKAGRRFAPTHELSLYPDALRACESLPGAHRGLLVIREMAGPIGIPDLTAVVGDADLLRARLEQPVAPILNQVDAAIVAATHAGVARSPAAIAASLGWALPTVSRRLDSLVRSGALLSAGRERLRRNPEIRSVGRIYAVEAKVRDRAAGIQQARAYRVWADSYVLVMGPLQLSTQVRLDQDVAADRGGLVVAGKWIRRPLLRRLNEGQRLWASEHVVAAMRGPSETYQPSVRA